MPENRSAWRFSRKELVITRVLGFRSCSGGEPEVPPGYCFNPKKAKTGEEIWITATIGPCSIRLPRPIRLLPRGSKPAAAAAAATASSTTEPTAIEDEELLPAQPVSSAHLTRGKIRFTNRIRGLTFRTYGTSCHAASRNNLGGRKQKRGTAHHTSGVATMPLYRAYLDCS
jgi:hypothetical protein